MDVLNYRRWWEAGSDTGSERNPGSGITLLPSNNPVWKKYWNRKNKLGLVTFAIICAIGIVISVGYIYLQNSFAHEMISRYDAHDHYGEGDDDDDSTESRTVIFVLPDSTPRNSSASTVGCGTSNNTFDMSNITLRSLPSNPYDKHPVSQLLELVRSPQPEFDISECPKRTPATFFKAVLTIGDGGDGVIGYGKSKKLARKAAAEGALQVLYDGIHFPQPDCGALERRCGG